MPYGTVESEAKPLSGTPSAVGYWSSLTNRRIHPLGFGDALSAYNPSRRSSYVEFMASPGGAHRRPIAN